MRGDSDGVGGGADGSQDIGKGGSAEGHGVVAAVEAVSAADALAGVMARGIPPALPAVLLAKLQTSSGAAKTADVAVSVVGEAREVTVHASPS